MTAPLSEWRFVQSDIWRGRAVRYVLIYLSLALALVAVRYATQDVRPLLRAAQEREAALTSQRDDLSLRVQALENPQRIRDWAFANGMRRFAQSPAITQPITPAETAPVSQGSQQTTPPAQLSLEVRTQWR